MAEAWLASAGGLTVKVRLTPRSARDAVESVQQLADGSAVIAARVRAVPEGGKANAALVRLLADGLDVAASRIRLVEGATNRIKRLTIEGEASALTAKLTALLAAQPSKR